MQFNFWNFIFPFDYFAENLWYLQSKPLSILISFIHNNSFMKIDNILLRWYTKVFSPSNFNNRIFDDIAV